MRNPKEEPRPSRRQVLLMGTTGALGLIGFADAVSRPAEARKRVLAITPALTEGPYFKDERLNRSDIRSDSFSGSVQSGFLLNLDIAISQLVNGELSPLTGAMVDIWHCNAAGKYSNFSSEGTAGKTFLRGYQLTNSDGKVSFTTIYPGWYSGRTVHIHSKVRLFSGNTQTYSFTTQFFFNEAFTDSIYTLSPYSDRNARDTRNSADGIYNGAGGDGVITTKSGSFLLPELEKDSSHAAGSIHFVVKR